MRVRIKERVGVHDRLNWPTDATNFKSVWTENNTDN